MISSRKEYFTQAPFCSHVLSPPAAICQSTAVKNPGAALWKINCCSHSAGSFAFFSAPREQWKFKENAPIAWIPSHLNCAWGSPGSDEGTYTPAVSNTAATSRIATANTHFFIAPSKITFTRSFLPHGSWAFFSALGTEGQPCNMSKRKPGSVLSPESYKGVRTEPLCLLVFGRGNIQFCSFLQALSQAVWSGKQREPEQILFPMAFQ